MDIENDYLTQSRFNGVKATLKEMISNNWAIDKIVACIYELFQEYIISEEQESELYAIADPEEKYNNCFDYYEAMDYENPLMEVLR